MCFRKEHQCDEKSNGPQFLTDLHNPNNVTCWRSDFVNSDSAENVTLTVSLKKKYFYGTCSYIILFLCFRKEHQCDEKSNGPQFLTDLHNPNNVTCWRSDFVNSDSAENVTLTVSLKKKYELTYVSLHFCHAKPHSMAIYKR